jgi:hypothetical protein
MLYELVTGRPPFQSDDYLTVVYQHKHESPPPPRRFRDMPRRLDRLILDCLAKSPAKRPANIGELRERVLDLLDELGGATSGERPVTGPSGPRFLVNETAPPRTAAPERPPPRSRPGRLAAVAGALALVGGLLLVPMWADPEAEGRARAPTPTDGASALAEPSPEPSAPAVEAPAEADAPPAEAALSSLLAVGEEARAALGSAASLAVEAAASVSPEPSAPTPDPAPAAPPVAETTRRDRRARPASPGGASTERGAATRDEPAAEAGATDVAETEPSAADRLRSLTGDLLRNPPPPESPDATE